MDTIKECAMTEWNNTPEQRQQLAEWVGRTGVKVYPAHPPDEFGMGCPARVTTDQEFQYDPANNDAQNHELLRKLVDEATEVTLSHGYTAQAFINIEPLKGQTLNNAICAAVWEVINEQ